MKKVLLITVLFAVTGLVAAQEQAQQGDAQYSPPPDGGRATGAASGVARLSLIRGDVSMQRGDSGDWVATTVNTPIVSGDTVATSEGGRAEIQLDYANALRLASQTQAKVANLSSGNIQIQVAQGYASLSTVSGDAQVEIDTPNVTLHPLKNGRYRVEVNSDEETNIVVREGEAEVSTAQGSTNVKEGEVITVRGTDDPEYKVSQAPGWDDWDQWNRDRDNTIHTAEGVRQTNQYYTGAQDLDRYGRWVNVPGYGQVWQPYDQPADWAPYQAGQWVWEPYYGWTWVSSEPWGWAPYHYGRWFYYGAGWYWWPGPVTPIYRPVWSPAFVSFIGFGHHVGFGFGYSSIGWFPCGPYDPFYPWWGPGYGTFGVVSLNFFFGGFHDHDHFGHDHFHDGFHGHGFSNLNTAFNNPRVRAGITTVNAENFGRAGGRFQHGVDVGTLRQASVARGNLGVVPTRESLSARGFSSAPSGIRAGASTHFVGRSPGASVPSFREQTARMQEAIRTRGGNSNFNGQGSVNGRFGGNSGSNIYRPNSSNGSRPGWSTFNGNQGQRGLDNSGRYGSHTFGGSNPGNQPHGNQGIENGNGRGGFSGNSSPNFPQNHNQVSSNSRTRLDLSKPIVVPRAQNNTSRQSFNPGNYNPGNYNRGAYGAPYGGNRSYNSAPYSGGPGGGNYRSYSGGGGRSYSGGGGRSYSTGSRGYSSGGGGRSSGGGHSSSHSSSHSGGHR